MYFNFLLRGALVVKWTNYKLPYQINKSKNYKLKKKKLETARN